MSHEQPDHTHSVKTEIHTQTQTSRHTHTDTMTHRQNKGIRRGCSTLHSCRHDLSRVFRGHVVHSPTTLQPSFPLILSLSHLYPQGKCSCAAGRGSGKWNSGLDLSTVACERPQHCNSLYTRVNGPRRGRFWCLVSQQLYHSSASSVLSLSFYPH